MTPDKRWISLMNIKWLWDYESPSVCVCVNECSVCVSVPSPVTNVSYAAAGSSINNNMMFIYWAGGVTCVWADGWTCACVYVCVLFPIPLLAYCSGRSVRFYLRQHSVDFKIKPPHTLTVCLRQRQHFLGVHSSCSPPRLVQCGGRSVLTTCWMGCWGLTSHNPGKQ